MPDSAPYYFARVVKHGRITSESLIAAIVEPVQVTRGKFLFTFTDIVRDEADRFVVANLSKYVAQGAIGVVEPVEHVAAPAEVPNMLVATARFVFIPAESIVAHQEVAGKIGRRLFEKAFRNLVEEKHENFFAECSLEPIVDLVTFVRKLATFGTITAIRATVSPPNPLFSPLWGSLQAHMRDRKVTKLTIAETSDAESGVATDLRTYAAAATGSEVPLEESYKSPGPPGVADAAVLMAADGYGRASVEGTRSGIRAVARTSESQLSLRIDKGAEPLELFVTISLGLSDIYEKRRLTHE